LLARLRRLTDTESPDLGVYLGLLRALTGRDLGYARAGTPAERAAARTRWIAFLSGQ